MQEHGGARTRSGRILWGKNSFSHDSNVDWPFASAAPPKRPQSMQRTKYISAVLIYLSIYVNEKQPIHDPPPEQDVDPGDNRKVHVSLDLVRYVGPETSPHDNVPAPPVRFLKRFPNARGDCCEHL